MIKVECIDLAAPWKEIEQSMLDLISKRAKGVE
jgi:hypothetical protein